MRATKRIKVIGIAAAAAVLAASVTAVALAQDSTTPVANTTTATDGSTAASDIPEGPYVDFCPTPEQTQAHLSAYGFDYKPLVACNRDGEVAPSGADSSVAAETTAASQVDSPAIDEREQQLLLEATTTKAATPDSPIIEGELPDGREVTVDLFTHPTERTTLKDLAEDAYP